MAQNNHKIIKNLSWREEENDSRLNSQQWWRICTISSRPNRTQKHYKLLGKD